jgi:hypothetical protein
MRTVGRLVLALLTVALLGAMLSPSAEAHRAAQPNALPAPTPALVEEAPSRPPVVRAGPAHPIRIRSEIRGRRPA